MALHNYHLYRCFVFELLAPRLVGSIDGEYRIEMNDVFGRTIEKGVRVVYMPHHAHGNLNHADVEHGEVVEVLPFAVFVRFDKSPTVKSATDPSLLTVQVDDSENDPHFKKIKSLLQEKV